MMDMYEARQNKEKVSRQINGNVVKRKENIISDAFHNRIKTFKSIQCLEERGSSWLSTPMHLLTTSQFKPIPDKEQRRYYCDDEYEFVKFEKFDEYYKIVSNSSTDIRLIYDGEEDAYFDMDYNFYDLPNNLGLNPPPSRSNHYYIRGIGTGVAYPEEDTVLDIFGLITCVGWVICNEHAAYATHILVSDYKHVNSENIESQVSKIIDLFKKYTNEAPNKLIIVQEKINEYKAYDWFQKLIPNGFSKDEVLNNNYQHKISQTKENKRSILWRCDRIDIKENSDQTKPFTFGSRVQRPSPIRRNYFTLGSRVQRPSPIRRNYFTLGSRVQRPSPKNRL